MRLITAIAGALACLLFAVPASAAKLHPRCNIDWPCIPAGGETAKKAQREYPQRNEISQLAKRGAGGEESRRISRADRFRNVEFGGPLAPGETQRSFLGGDLVSKARQYMGTNPTGWRSLWCARFMSMIAPQAAGHVKNPNQARSWASLPRVSPQVGAIAVLARGKRGGHIGVVSGFDVHGNPIIVSGNHGRTVGEGVYSSKRVLAYVSAS